MPDTQPNKNTTIPATPSEAFQSVCNRIAGDLGQMEAGARQYAAVLDWVGAGTSAMIFPRLYAIVSGKSGAGKDDIYRGLNALLHAATFTPEFRPTKRQELLKVLRWDPDAPVYTPREKRIAVEQVFRKQLHRNERITALKSRRACERRKSR